MAVALLLGAPVSRWLHVASVPVLVGLGLADLTPPAAAAAADDKTVDPSEVDGFLRTAAVPEAIDTATVST